MIFHIQYRPWWFLQFSAIRLAGCSTRYKWGPYFENLLLGNRKPFFAWIKLFQVNKSFSKKNSSHEDLMAPICAHARISKWTKISRECLNNGTCRNTMKIPQTARHWLIKTTIKVLKYTTIWKILVDWVSRCFPDINIHKMNLNLWLMYM